MRVRTFLGASAVVVAVAAAAVLLFPPRFEWPDRIWVPADGFLEADWEDARLEPAGERVHVAFCIGLDDTAFLRREDSWARRLARILRMLRPSRAADWAVLYDETGHVERDGRTWFEFTRRPDTGG